MERAYILGKLKFFSNADAVPNEGISVTKLRLEFTLNPAKDQNWMVEVETLGPLPWFRDEERNVKVRALSDIFAKQLASYNEPVYVLRGTAHIGMFELESL